jgi:hypothetical protein
MTYKANIFKLFTDMNNDLWRLQKAERFEKYWKVNFLMLLAAVLIYIWMASLGIGADLVSRDVVDLDAGVYQVHHFWFVIGRVLYAAVFWAFTLFGVAALLYLATGIPFRKLVLVQQLVLAILLAERLIWIPLAVYAGLDWYSSPMSLGVIASYLTDKPWIIYFFGSISIFQIGVMCLQVKCIHTLGNLSKRGVWAAIIFLHIFEWCIAVIFTVADTYMIGGWFG